MRWRWRWRLRTSSTTTARRRTAASTSRQSRRPIPTASARRGGGTGTSWASSSSWCCCRSAFAAALASGSASAAAARGRPRRARSAKTSRRPPPDLTCGAMFHVRPHPTHYLRRVQATDCMRLLCTALAVAEGASPLPGGHRKIRRAVSGGGGLDDGPCGARGRLIYLACVSRALLSQFFTT